MTGRLRVDLAWLEQLLTRLNGSADTATTAFDALHETGPIRTGHKSLDKACDAFQKSCASAVKDLRSEISALSVGLLEARARYGSTEQAVTAALTPEGGPGTVPPANGSVPQTDIRQVLG